MILAFAEIRRRPGRFASVVGALTLLVFLVLVLAALADGLYFGATGAIRTSRADLYAFDRDASGSFVRSRLPQRLAAEAARVDGVAEVGALGTLLTVGRGPRGQLDVAVFGAEPGRVGAPPALVDGRLPRPGEDGAAAADTRLRRDGVRLGTRLEVTGAADPVEVVGFVRDASYQLQPTLWTTVGGWRRLRSDARPETRGDTATVTALAVRVRPGADPAQVARRLDAATGVTDTRTRASTVLAIPGVAQQQSTLRSIIVASLLVAGLVVALFFALLTLEKRDLLAALKAVGASTRLLGVGVVVQGLAATGAAVLLGAVLARLVGLVLPEQVPALFRTVTVVVVAAATVLSGLVGSAFSLRRVARIDPATALGGALT